MYYAYAHAYVYTYIVHISTVFMWRLKRWGGQIRIGAR